MTPVIHGQHLLVGGIGQTTSAIQLSGDVQAQKVETIWTNPKAPLHMSSPVLVGDRLFGLSSRRKGQLFCLNANSGETIWTSEGSFAQHVAILQGDGHLIILTNDGKLIFVKTDSETYQPLASYNVSESRTWAHPLISGNRIIIKNEDSLTCWEL